jgi:adenylate kinase family enzyme
MTFSPPQDPVVAARLQQRADDTEAKVKVRLQAFHENLAPILAAYKQHTLRVSVNSNETDSNVQKNAIFNRIKVSELPVLAVCTSSY